ncbi:SpcZ [Streptomyces sp. NBC_01136]|uniref:SpcZ n=1 Tax=Streptomyces sp. NBC_01136 TaxID=2903754 RepID=UPI00386B97D0|nr:SpcZ [Streptomyces sp. NBC_01136]
MTSAPPTWFAELTGVLHEGQSETAGADWARRLHTALSDGRVPVTLDVVHAWHLYTVIPLLAAADARAGRTTAACAALAAAHERALEGRSVTREEWADLLEPVLRQVYRDAYGFEEAFAVAYENARAYAVANGFDGADADKYGTDYAESTTEPNTRAYAEANALANARAVAAAYATADAEAFARTFPGARTRAYARAVAADARHTSAYARLAEGLLTALERGPFKPLGFMA